MRFPTLLKLPSAFLPVAMSFAAIVLVFGSVVFSGTAREADEGATAHMWQLLVAGQLPMVAFFAIKWLPRTPKPALTVLAIQGAALLAALSPVYVLNL